MKEHKTFQWKEATYFIENIEEAEKIEWSDVYKMNINWKDYYMKEILWSSSWTNIERDLAIAEIKSVIACEQKNEFVIWYGEIYNDWKYIVITKKF